MKVSDIYRTRAPKSTTLDAETVPVADRIKHGAGYIFSTDEVTGEMTPKKRLNYTPPARPAASVPTDGSSATSLRAYACPITGNYEVLNPEWIPDILWNEACERAIAVFKEYIPPQHEHLVLGIGEYDIDGLENSLFGRAKSDPLKFCAILQTTIETLKIERNKFDEEGAQWYQRMQELYAAMKSLAPIDDIPLSKMREEVFVNHVMRHLREVLPSMTKAYNNEMILGKKWGIKEMKEIVDRYMKAGKFKVENGKSKSTREKPSLLKQTANVKKVNDNSKAQFDKDAYFDEQQVLDDGKMRPDSFEYLQQQHQILETKLAQFEGGKGYGGNGYRDNYQGYQGGKGYDGKGGYHNGYKGGKGAGYNDYRSPGKGYNGYGQPYDNTGISQMKLKHHCDNCERLGMTDGLIQNHDAETCNKPGGKMQGRQTWECQQEQQRLDYDVKVKKVKDLEDKYKRERETPTTGEGAAKQAKTFTYPSFAQAKPPETVWSPGGGEWHEPNYEGAANQWLQQQPPPWQQQLSRAQNQYETPQHQSYTDDRGVEMEEAHFGIFAITIKIDPRHLIQTRKVQQVSDGREHGFGPTQNNRLAKKMLQEILQTKDPNIVTMMDKEGTETLTDETIHNIDLRRTRQMNQYIEDTVEMIKRVQLDSGCCGLNMLKDGRLFPYGTACGTHIHISTAVEGQTGTAKKYGVAVGSFPRIDNVVDRRSLPRQAFQLGLSILDDRYHELINENRFDIETDGTNTPHRVDKKNKCIWMYENTEQQCIIPVTWERDAIYIDFRPLTTKEAIEYVASHPMEDKEWKMGPQSTDRPHKIRKTIQQNTKDIRRWQCQLCKDEQQSKLIPMSTNHCECGGFRLDDGIEIIDDTTIQDEETFTRELSTTMIDGEQPCW